MDVAAKAKRQTTTEVGQKAENLALRYLQSKGLSLIEKNFSCRYGEIDLVMLHKKVVVFVEVRYRKNTQFGTGAETVDYRKQQKLLNTAQYYLQHHHNYSQLTARIDVVSISKQLSEAVSNINWIQNAVHN